MRRALPIIVVILVVGVGVFGVLRLTGCGGSSTRTRIAQKKLYEGPATMPAGAGDWPRWRGPDGDGISRETGLAERWPDTGPVELWSAEVGIGYASPIAAAGRIYMFSVSGGRESLTCFDANSGKIIWNQEGGAGRTTNYPGTRATPTIDAGDMFTLGGTGELTCRDVTNGNRRWVTNVLSETEATALDWGTASSPLIDGNLVYVQGGQGGPIAVAVDRKTGSIAWRSQAAGVAGYASPILASVEGETQLIVFGGKAAFGMDPKTGRTLWQHPWSTSYDVNACTPIYRDGHLFLTSGYGSGAVMLQISRDSAKELWRNRDAQSRFQPAILDGDTLYLNSENITLMAIAWSDGHVLWKDSPRATKLGLGGSFVRFIDGKMISIGENGRLSLVRATPAKLEVLSSTKVLEGNQIWATPLVYGGRLYLKGEQELVCYDISAATPNAK